MIRMKIREEVMRMTYQDAGRSGEQQFLSAYDQSLFDRPSIAADIAAFSLQTQQEELYRRDPERKLCLLLIRRGEHPYLGQWALPGGFLRRNETVEECALRELREETGLEAVSMLSVDVFSDPGRDPRGWIVSCGFASVITEEAAVLGGSDAAEARWFQIGFTAEEQGISRLELRSEDTVLTARLAVSRSLTGGDRYEILESRGLAFDHAKIIAAALGTLRSKAEDLQIVFDLLPEKFTLSALQKVQETLMGISHLSANFRRKVADLVVETDEFTEGAGHRPARLYKRNRK